MDVAKKVTWFRPRFSLWAMLVLVTVAAIPLAYVAQRRSFNLRRKAAWEFLASKGIGLRNNGFPVGKTPLEELTLWQRIIAEEPAIKIDRVMARCGSGGQQSIPSLAASDLPLFGYFPEIESLQVCGPCEAGDEAFAFLSQLQNLKSLGISAFPNVRGAFLQRLHCERTLEGLTLHSLEKLEGENIPNLESFPVLDLLDVEWCQLLNDESLRGVNLPHTIEYLGIAGSIGDETLARWLKKGTVKHLSLDTSMSRHSASVMQHQIELVSIEVTNAPWIDEDFEFLRHCKNVEELHLTSMPIEGAFLEWISQPESIRKLDFHNTLFSDSHLAKLARFSELEELDFSWTPLSGMGFDMLKSLPEGCQLQLVGARFTSDGKRALAHCRPLRVLGGISLPANWTAQDMLLFDNADEEWRYCLSADAAVDTKRMYGKYLSFYLANDVSRLTAPCDRCPAELMTPVLELHELARRPQAKAEQIRNMLKEEGRKPLFRVREGDDGVEQ